MSLQVCTGGLVGNLRLWTVPELVSSVWLAVTKAYRPKQELQNREIIANHLVYTLWYMFLVAELYGKNTRCRNYGTSVNL